MANANVRYVRQDDQTMANVDDIITLMEDLCDESHDPNAKIILNFFKRLNRESKLAVDIAQRMC